MNIDELQKMADEDDVLLDLDTVKKMVNLSKSTIYREIKAKRFPAQVKQSPGRSGWLRSEIRAHMRGLNLNRSVAANDHCNTIAA